VKAGKIVIDEKDFFIGWKLKRLCGNA